MTDIEELEQEKDRLKAEIERLSLDVERMSLALEQIADFIRHAWPERRTRRLVRHSEEDDNG